MHRIVAILIPALIIGTAVFGQTSATSPGSSPIRGFASEDWKARHELEEKAKALAQPERIRISMERIAGRPHHAGSPGAKAVADYAAAQLTEWGLSTNIETFDALLPYPATRSLEMISPVRFRASLKEPPIPSDAATADNGQLPTYNAYSAAGDVTAPLIYVNYGTPEDYAYLKRQGLDVRGKIALVRYGKVWRGLKPKLAQDNGAVACLIYSDPRDDGYFQGDPYPKGFARPEGGVQRGSVMEMTLYPGDPLTPGWASEPGARRLTRDEAASLLKIPVMPLSWGDAKPLLEQLEGQVAPESWRGALPLTYHIGPGPATVHFKIDFDWSNRPLYNVLATIPGSTDKDQWIVYGNHHDAWANGASDPSSGAAALLETARILALLVKQGWQPKRTIVLALWDGEEFGLVGSTEWAEKHREELDRKAAVYMNSDSNGLGILEAAGSHTLEAFLKEVMRDVTDPATSKNLLELARSRTSVRSASARGADFHLAALGAGSDYVVFLDHLGIASLNLGFGTGESGGVYHSIYDTLDWYNRFSDTDRVYGKTLAQLMAVSILRLADASVLPFEFETFSETIRRYVGEIQKDAPARAGTLDLRGISDQLAKLSAAAKTYEDELTAWWSRSSKPGAPAASFARLNQTRLNQTLMRAERALLAAGGLPRREWYRHQIYAPGVYTGYGAKTIPGVREAVEAQQWREANGEARRVTQALRAMTAQVEEASHLLKTAE